MTQDRGIVIVSHAEQQIKNLCNQAIWINEGRVAPQGEPASVLQGYAGQQFS